MLRILTGRRIIGVLIFALVVAGLVLASSHNSLPGTISKQLSGVSGGTAAVHTAVGEAKPASTGVPVPPATFTLVDGSRALVSLTLMPSGATLVSTSPAQQVLGAVTGPVSVAQLRAAVLAAYHHQLADVRAEVIPVH